jgi:ribosomal-protein-alanine N-acetyltransferase
VEPTWSVDALSRAAFRWSRLRQTALEWHEDGGYGFPSPPRRRCLPGRRQPQQHPPAAAQSANLGYWIGEAYARQGYTIEALQALVLFAVFDWLGLHRIEAACPPHNAASRAPPAEAGISRGRLCAPVPAHQRQLAGPCALCAFAQRFAQ